MSLTRRQFSRALVIPALLTGTLGMVSGCGGTNPDQTGDAGIGAPGKLPANPVPEENYEDQLKREKAAMKESSK